ncbi:hypothetical protein U9M48_013612 [Paspalum notatum var. saurae]|uniref:Uncharacterized protein n=1 Tax=Paspalum notatum var. saurae TaxID=547442 RepID=A0AAQ3WJQ4_PASNO
MNFGLVGSPVSSICERLAAGALYLKRGHLDKFESRCLDGIFLGMLLVLGLVRPSKLLRLVRFLLMKLCPAQPLPLSFQVMMKKAPPSLRMRKVQLMMVMQEPLHRLQLLSTPAAAPVPSATSSDDEGGPLPTASSSLLRQQAHAEAGPAEDTGEVTFKIVPSRRVRRDHPPHGMIGDIHRRVTRSLVNSLAFFSHSHMLLLLSPGMCHMHYPILTG